MHLASALPLLLVLTQASEPADALPWPQPERCLGFLAEAAEGEAVTYQGLGYEEVKPPLDVVLRQAARCPRPAGVSELHLTFELLVGCDGLVKAVEASEPDAAPAPYLACVQAVLRKADFPPHDMPDGFPITYPVNVAW